MLAAERSRLVRRAVAALPPHLREGVSLREYEELDNARLAEITGTAPGTIKSRLARAREQLRRELAPLLKEDRP
jgi:RNA polymerase sigma-70 factor (ECF subfamily)